MLTDSAAAAFETSGGTRPAIIFECAGRAHRPSYLDAADEVCEVGLRRRNESGEHEFTVSAEDFDLFAAHFVPPAVDEALEVVLRRQ